MFQTYFDLARRPFASVPSPDDYFPSNSVEAARTSLVRLIEREEGPAIVVGQVGIGKSLLCQLLADSFRHRCRTVVLPSGRLCTRRSLLQVILYQLGLSYRDQDEGELRLTLIDHLTNRSLCPNGILLLVDEADDLPMSLLDELRAITNLMVDNEACVRLVLFGSPRLEEKFTHPRLESFNQRLAGRFYLEPFRTEETRDYIESRISECGADPSEVFTPEAITAIQRATGGIPRLINQVSDHALVLAAADDRLVVDASSIEEAWADLQQLPMPFERGGHSSRIDFPADIIEFGELDSVDGNVAARAEQHLSQIESHIDGADPDDEDYQPLLTELDEIETSTSPDLPGSTPEVTLYFHAPHNPFGDDFEEEELVVDQFTPTNTPGLRPNLMGLSAEAESKGSFESDQDSDSLVTPSAADDVTLGESFVADSDAEAAKTEPADESSPDAYAIAALDLVEAVEDAIHINAMHDQMSEDDSCEYILGEFGVEVIHVAAAADESELGDPMATTGDASAINSIVTEELLCEFEWTANFVDDEEVQSDSETELCQETDVADDACDESVPQDEDPSFVAQSELDIESPPELEPETVSESEPEFESEPDAEPESTSEVSDNDAEMLELVPVAAVSTPEPIERAPEVSASSYHEHMETETERHSAKPEATNTASAHDYRRLFSQLRRPRR